MKDHEMFVLRDLRETAKMSQREVADKLKHTQSWVSKLEQCDNPRLRDVEAYLNAIGIEMVISIKKIC